MSELKYPSPDCLEPIHDKILEQSEGGASGVYDIGRLESVLCNIQNDEYYPTLIDKITHLFFCTCKFHCFVDGNKRMAISLGTYFLLLNSYRCAEYFFTTMEDISYHVASGNIDKDFLHRIIDAVINETYEDDMELQLELLRVIDN